MGGGRSFSQSLLNVRHCAGCSTYISSFHGIYTTALKSKYFVSEAMSSFGAQTLEPVRQDLIIILLLLEYVTSPCLSFPIIK